MQKDVFKKKYFSQQLLKIAQKHSKTLLTTTLVGPPISPKSPNFDL